MNKLGCLPHVFFILLSFFPVIKAAVFYMEFWFMTNLPQNSRQSSFEIHQHSEQNVKLEITKRVCKVWLIKVLLPQNLEKNPCAGKKWMVQFSREFCLCVELWGRVHLPRKTATTAPLKATLGKLRAGSPSGFSLNSSWRSECS